jgi:hypothetical protein
MQEKMKVDDLPRAISTATMQVGPLKLTVHNLDNGQRVVDADSMERFMHFLATGEAIEPAIDASTERNDHAD